MTTNRRWPDGRGLADGRARRAGVSPLVSSAGRAVASGAPRVSAAPPVLSAVEGVSSTAGRGAAVPGLRLWAAFAAVYVIWGSTYLAIRYAIETLPPLLMAGARFTIAGVLVYVWLRVRGGARPSPAQWRGALVVGGLMLVGGNGSLSWAEQVVVSGVASLIVAMVPIWMVLLEGVRRGGDRPDGVIVGGLALGTLGVGLLVGPQGLISGQPVDPVGAGVLVLGSLLWAAGSLRSRGLSVGGSPLLATSMVMVCGGIELMLAGALTGELRRLDLGAVSARSVLAFAYLILLGSIVAYSAYIWLMRHATPARVSTYAYVNPVIALVVGFSLGGEPLALRTLAAAALIITSVVMIQLGRSRSGRPFAPPRALSVARRRAGMPWLRSALPHGTGPARDAARTAPASSRSEASGRIATHAREAPSARRSGSP